MSDTPMTELPDGSGCCTATILSEEEAMSLPLNQRPLNYRLPGDLYHAVFEAIGAASMCWDPRPANQVFDSRAAEKVAMDLCFKIASELDLRPNCPDSNPDLDCGEGYRFLRPGETILEGDQAWMGGMSGLGWCPTSRLNRPVPMASAAPQYRRRKSGAPAATELETYGQLLGPPIAPDNYFHVPVGDPICEGDLFRTAFGRWVPVPPGALGTAAPSGICRRNPPPAPTPTGEGYRILLNNETAHYSDEVYWRVKPRTMKTDLDPGEGYRILDRGEAIRGSDEFLDHGKWCCVSSIPCLTDLRVQNIKIRRKIDLDQPPQSASMPTG